MNHQTSVAEALTSRLHQLSLRRPAKPPASAPAPASRTQPSAREATRAPQRSERPAKAQGTVYSRIEARLTNLETLVARGPETSPSRAEMAKAVEALKAEMAEVIGLQVDRMEAQDERLEALEVAMATAAPAMMAMAEAFGTFVLASDESETD